MKSDLLQTDLPQVELALRRLATPVIEEIEQSVRKALTGDTDAIRRYVLAYFALLHRCLGAAAELRPDLVARVDDQYVLVDANHRPMPYYSDILAEGALQAPFSIWVDQAGPGLGIGLFALWHIRHLLRETPPLIPDWKEATLPVWELDDSVIRRFLRRTWIEVNRSDDPLRRIGDVFDLTVTELARLFGVSRQAIQQWIEDGVPTARREKLATIQAIADLLERKIKQDRIPGIARRNADAYGNRSMLRMIEQNQQDALLEDLRSSFDWAATA